MTDYEVLIMLDPELAEDRQQEVIDRIRSEVVGGGGVWETHAPWGRRRLAYEIQHKSEGIYHLITFSAPAEVLSEVSPCAAANRAPCSTKSRRSSVCRSKRPVAA